MRSESRRRLRRPTAMTMRNRAFVIAVLAAGSALAQDAANLPPFEPGLYPPEVGQALHYPNEECTRQGGAPVTLPPDPVRKRDLTGDRPPDYIASFRETTSHAAHAVPPPSTTTHLPPSNSS